MGGIRTTPIVPQNFKTAAVVPKRVSSKGSATVQLTKSVDSGDVTCDAEIPCKSLFVGKFNEIAATYRMPPLSMDYTEVNFK